MKETFTSKARQRDRQIDGCRVIERNCVCNEIGLLIWLCVFQQALFIGFGPDFKVNQTSKSFRNVELYNLMCQLLNITPVSNNGKLLLARHMGN